MAKPSVVRTIVASRAPRAACLSRGSAVRGLPPPRRGRPTVSQAGRSTTGRSPVPTLPRSWWSCERPNRSAFSMTITVAFGTSIPTSITVVATRISSSRSLELPHHRSFSSLGSLPWSSPSRRSGNSSAAGIRSATSRTSGPPSPTPRSGDRRSRPASPPRPVPARIGRRSLVRRRRFRTVVIGFRSPRQLVEDRHIEIAVERQRQGPGDRRRGHDQDVGILPFPPDRRPLPTRRIGAARRSPRVPAGRTPPPSRTARGCRRRSARWPLRTSSRMSRRRRERCAPTSRRMRYTGRSASSAVSVSKCCSARISVGAMNTAW